MPATETRPAAPNDLTPTGPYLGIPRPGRLPAVSPIEGVPVGAASPAQSPADLAPVGPVLGIPKLDPLPTVSLLVGSRNGVVAVYESREAAEAKRDQYNVTAHFVERAS